MHFYIVDGSTVTFLLGESVRLLSISLSSAFSFVRELSTMDDEDPNRITYFQKIQK